MPSSMLAIMAGKFVVASQHAYSLVWSVCGFVCLFLQLAVAEDASFCLIISDFLEYTSACVEEGITHIAPPGSQATIQ